MKLFAIGLFVQLFAVSIFWKLAYLTVVVIHLYSHSRFYPWLQPIALLAFVAYLGVGCLAVIKKSWLFSGLFCLISVAAAPWPLLGIFLSPHPH